MDESYEPYMEETDHEEDDTLSLSDLPIYGESVEHDDFRADDHALDDDYDSAKCDDQAFEFFSGEWSTAPSSFPSTTLDPNVVFCGKVIPYKEVITPAITERDNSVVPETKKPRKRWYITLSWWTFTWKSMSLRSSTHSTSQRCIYEGENNEIRASRSVPMVMAAAAPSTKSKWYLFVFGLSRLPPKMHVGDLRRRHGSLRSSGSVSASDSTISKSSGLGGDKGVGWWALIRVLGCGGGGDGVDHHATAVVTAAQGLATPV